MEGMNFLKIKLLLGLTVFITTTHALTINIINKVPIDKRCPGENQTITVFYGSSRQDMRYNESFQFQIPPGNFGVQENTHIICEQRLKDFFNTLNAQLKKEHQKTVFSQCLTKGWDNSCLNMNIDENCKVSRPVADKDFVCWANKMPLGQGYSVDGFYRYELIGKKVGDKCNVTVQWLQDADFNALSDDEYKTSLGNHACSP